MYKRIVSIFIICAVFLTFSALAQETAEKKELDFADIQSTPEKVLSKFFELFKKVDVENMKKLCIEEMHQDIDQFAKFINSMDNKISFEFMTHEFLTKEDYSVVKAEILVSNKDEKEFNFSLISIKKIDQKWFIVSLNELPEDAPEWADAIRTELKENLNYLTKYREGQTSPYFVVYEYMSSLAEKNVKTIKELTVTNDKLQKSIIEYMNEFDDAFKVVIGMKNVCEQADYAVCELDLTFEEMDPKAIVIVLKNEGFNNYPSWKVIPLMTPDLYLDNEMISLPEWVLNRVKYFMDPKQEIKDKNKMFVTQLDQIKAHMLSGEYDKLAELFGKSDQTDISKIKEDIDKITKFDCAFYHIMGSEALALIDFKVIEKGDEKEETDDMPLSATYKDGKWAFSFRPDEKTMPWIDGVSEYWKTIIKNKNKSNYRPSSEFNKIEDPYGYGYGYEKQPEAKVNNVMVLGKPFKGEVKGYGVTNVDLNIEKAGVYRIVAECQTEGADLVFYVKQNELAIGNVTNFKGYTAIELFLTPGKYLIQFNKGFETPNDINTVEFVATGILIDPENLPETLPMIEPGKEYIYDDLNQDNGREGFIKIEEAGFYLLELDNAGDKKSSNSGQNLSVEVYMTPSRYFSNNFKLPSSKLIFMPKGLNKIEFSTWDKKVIPTKFTLKKAEIIKHGDTKTVDIPKSSEIGWQFKLDIPTKINFELTGKTANSIFMQIMQKNSETQLQPSWGKSRAISDILDPGVYLVKLVGDWNKDSKNVTLNAKFTAIGFPQVAPKYKSQTIINTKAELSGKSREIDLTGYRNSKFVCIKVIDNKTGMIIPESSIRLLREKIDGISNKDYVRMKTTGNAWNLSLTGNGCVYGYLLPTKYEMFINIFADVQDVKLEITLEDDVVTLETGKYQNLKMKSNNVTIYKIEVTDAKTLSFDSIFLSSLGKVEGEIWKEGFQQSEFTNWGMDNGFSIRGLFTKGTYYVVLKRVPRTKWMPDPEIDELPVIINCFQSFLDN